MLAKSFGERLHRYREDRGLSQRQLAQLAGIDAMSISRYERGATLPTADALAEIAKTLHVTADALLFGKANRQEQPKIKNVLLLQRLEDISNLDPKDQATLIEVIDSLIARRQVDAISKRRRSA
jgi:transcriptional regulator with XRE-family HTH domain